MNGILVVDKPAGCTSHDVVQRVRKALRQRSVGHAGTLDPLATGVLVVAVGEGTKLVSHLQSDDKRYEVTIALGAETDSLDADGEVTETGEVPPLDARTVEQALQAVHRASPAGGPQAERDQSRWHAASSPDAPRRRRRGAGARGGSLRGDGGRGESGSPRSCAFTAGRASTYARWRGTLPGRSGHWGT